MVVSSSLTYCITGEARLASMGPEGVASERAALRAKLAEQQRAAEEATTEAYNQERASEAQDAATQQEADRGRQRAAAVQRRKESDAAAVAAAELAGQQQPVRGCVHKLLIKTFLNFFQVICLQVTKKRKPSS